MLDSGSDHDDIELIPPCAESDPLDAVSTVSDSSSSGEDALVDDISSAGAAAPRVFKLELLVSQCYMCGSLCSYSDSILLHILVHQLVIKEPMECVSDYVVASEILWSALVV